MQNQWRKQRGHWAWRRLVVGGVIAFLAMVAWLPEVRGSIWTPPPSGAPGGTVGIPVNLSRSYQTMTGAAVTFSGGLTVSNTVGTPTVRIGTSTEPVSIVWNGLTYTNWPTTSGGSFLMLSDASGLRVNTGWASIQGLGAGAGDPATLTLLAANPLAGTPSKALYAVDDPGGAFNSYAIFAEVSSTDVNSAAVAGYTDFNSNAWAGFFSGNVGLSRTADLMVGYGGQLNGNQAGVGELCIYDTNFGTTQCRSSWPADLPADPYWTDNSGINRIEVKDVGYDIALGGTTPSSPMFIDSVPSQSTANLSIRGSTIAATSVNSKLTIQ